MKMEEESTHCWCYWYWIEDNLQEACRRKVVDSRSLVQSYSYVAFARPKDVAGGEGESMGGGVVVAAGRYSLHSRWKETEFAVHSPIDWLRCCWRVNQHS